MPKSWIRVLLIFAATVLIVASSDTLALANQSTGAISGTITEPSGNPVANVSVSAVSSSQTAKTVTGANGFYAMTGLAPDIYTVTLSKSGYRLLLQRGITVVQGETFPLSLTIETGPKVLAKLTVRSAASLIQPNRTADKYTVDDQEIRNITGTPQDISETAVLESIAGITTDDAGHPIIRGGAENEEGYELEGIDATDPITGQFINSFSLVGTSRIVVETGGYDVSEGNTNAGVVNEVVKRGSYPGGGQATMEMNSPNFDHRFMFDYGNGTPDKKFGYYVAYSGLRQFRVYGDTKTFLPRLVGQVGAFSGNVGLTNLFYRWGRDGANELEYLGETGAGLFQFNYGIEPAITPYASANGFVAFTYNNDAGFNFQPFLTPFPGQAAVIQNTGYPDNENNVNTIEKLNFKRQFTASSYGDLFIFRTIESDNYLFPWGGGAFGDSFEHNVNDNTGISFDYANQLDSRNEIGFGGETVFTRSKYDAGFPSFEPFVYGPFSGSTVDCYIETVSSAFGFLCPAARTLLTQYPPLTGVINDPLHRGNVWIKDRFAPNDKLTATAGVRWDEEALDIPSDAQSQNTTYVIDSTGNYVEVPGPKVTSDVTRPTQVSPRFALSYHPNGTNVFTFSYGKNIEFAPFFDIESKAGIDPALARCNVANGCFTKLQGFGTTNNVTNLNQQVVESWNTNNFGQFTPVRPQRATNFDLGWSHDFGNGLEMRIEPYYRKGADYVVANTPLLTTLSDGTPIFGAPREENAGFNKNTGVEFAFDRLASHGFTGFIHLTYDNTLENYNSDFFPSVNDAALALGHVFHASYLAPITGAMNFAYAGHNGMHVTAEFQYESGYRYGVGTHTFVFLPVGPLVGGAPSLEPVEVPNTDLAANALGLNANTSAYYFTDPSNPGTILHPNITGSRGTPDGTDPGTLHGPQIMTMNLSLYHDLGAGENPVQVGMRVLNVLGNYTDAVVGGNSRYRNNGLGGFGPTSGTNSVLSQFEPYQYPRSPLPFENEPTGTARTMTFFVTSKF